MRPRIIPVLSIENGGLVKTVKFGKRTYIGDPINAIRLFNDLEVDELIIIDINATKEGRLPDTVLIKELVSEAFVPVAYGGGVHSLELASTIFSMGVEKVIFNSATLRNPELVSECVSEFGSSAIVGAFDVKKNLLQKSRIYDHTRNRTLRLSPHEHLQKLISLNVGEIFINSVDRDGVMGGYDLEFLNDIIQRSTVPVICCGGGASLDDLKKAAALGLNGIAAGSMFIFHGATRGVLINYPDQNTLEELFKDY